MQEQLIIGSRASPLALRQSEMVKTALLRAFPHLVITIVSMTTLGDRATGKPLSDWGYKGLFTKELEDALLEKRIDIAVHSMKDMPSTLPEGLIIAATLPRDDARDGWISLHYPSYEQLPAGALIGTSSLRRSAQIKLRHPTVRIVPLRGNVQTRLNKLTQGEAQATFLACAGLDRLQQSAAITERLPPETMLPAVTQGIIGVQARANDAQLLHLLQAIHHIPTFTAAICERAMLQVLDGSCRTPIAGYAQLQGERVFLCAQVIAPDGSAQHSLNENAAVSDAEHLGRSVGSALKQIVPPAWLKEAL